MRRLLVAAGLFIVVATVTAARVAASAAASSSSIRSTAVDASFAVHATAGETSLDSKTAVTATGPGPLHVDPTGRYLVDPNDEPFLLTGDSPQALIGDLTPSDAALFFSTRRAQGFNSVWINLVCNNYTGCAQDGSTWDGVMPFTTPGDLSTPNEAYFSRADQMLQLAAQNGFVVLLDPIETGGWLNTLIANGVDKDRAYGQYLGRRYGGLANIIWMSGNDYQNWGPATDPYVTAVMQGIRDTDPSALQTIELNFPSSGSLDDPAFGPPVIDIYASYTYNPTYMQVLSDYNRRNALPDFMVEAGYEDEQNTPLIPYGSPQQLRRQEYWSLLSGAMGQLFGNHYIWQFACSQRDSSGNCLGGWKDQLASPGATQMANVIALFSSRPWYELVPDQNHTVISGGYGTFGGTDYVTAARTPDGKLAMAYVPSARTVTVNLGTFTAPVMARWYDPTNGTFTAIGGGPMANGGNVSLTTPGANAEGTDDWVLVLEAPGQPAVSASPGSTDFGNQRVGTVSAAQTFTIANSGTATLNISTVTVAGADAGQYVKSNDHCSGQRIAPKGVCTVLVAFAPTSPGIHDSASLNIISNAASSPDTISLTGNAVAAAVAPSPAFMNFGSQRVGTLSPAQMFTITNSGTATLNISTVALAGADAGQYVVTNDQCAGQALVPTTSCTVDVAFDPSSPGPHNNASLQITSDALSSPDELALRGIGTQPALSVSPPSQDFGSQRVGTVSAPQTFTITNAGTGTLTISTVALLGADAAQYVEASDHCSGRTIAATNACTVDIAFAPTSTGAHNNATLDIASDAPSSPDNLPLTGTGVVSAVSASPASKNFGKQRRGTQSPTQTFTITNTGAAPLNISSVALTGADRRQYVLSNNHCAGQLVAPADSCTVDVAFRPVSPGPHDHASLQIVSDAPSSPDSLPLRGQAIGPPVKWLLTHARVTHVNVRPNGAATVDVTVPVAGIVNVMESIWNPYRERRAVAAATEILLHGPSSRLVVARVHLVVRKQGTVHINVSATQRMNSLFANHRRPIRGRLWVTFVPPIGPRLLLGVYGLVVTR